MGSGRVLLALDLATHTGWAEGTLGDTPRFGSIRFADVGSGRPAMFSGAFKWIGTRLQAFRPHVIAYENPFAPSVMKGHTNRSTALVLLGLPAVMQAVGYTMGIYSFCGCKPQTVRQYFINQGRLPSAEAKRAVMQRCRELGHEVKNDNEADALALWYYVDHCLTKGLTVEAINEDR